MHIVIINVVMLNGGDRAILETEQRLLRLAVSPAPVRFTIVDDYADVASRYFPDEEVVRGVWQSSQQRSRPGAARRWRERAAKVRNMVRTIRMLAAMHLRRPGLLRRALVGARAAGFIGAVQSADLVVATGGTMLVDYYNPLARICDLAVVRASRVPYVFFTQSLGPYRRWHHRMLFRPLFNDAAVILLRDARSLRHLQEAGCATGHCHVAPDVVFALADPGELAHARHRRLRVTDAPTVLVTVRGWSHFQRRTPDAGMEAIRDSLAAAITRIVDDYGGRVIMASTCQGVVEYPHDDSIVAREILARLSPAVRARVDLRDQFMRTPELLDLVREADWVISMRMHMAIMALCTGRPVLPVAYEFKTHELFAGLGAGDWVIDIEAINPNAMRSALDHFTASCPARHGELLAAVERQRVSALGVIELLRAVTGGAGRKEWAA